MQVRAELMEQVGRARFVQRMSDMLLESGAVDAGTDRKLLKTLVAAVLDEAGGHGIRTERLMGMYLILRIADKVVPFEVPEYAKVLLDPDLPEAEKAHQLQMIRLDAL